MKTEKARLHRTQEKRMLDSRYIQTPDSKRPGGGTGREVGEERREGCRGSVGPGAWGMSRSTSHRPHPLGLGRRSRGGVPCSELVCKSPSGSCVEKGA